MAKKKLIGNEATAGGLLRKRTLSSVYLAEVDRQAVEYLRHEHVIKSMASVVVFAIEKQHRRDEDPAYDADAEYLAKANVIRRGCMKMLSKTKTYGRDEMDLKVTTFIRHAETADAMEAIRAKWDFNEYAEAVRFAVRVQAAMDGFVPLEGWYGTVDDE